jgi:hypothetical protein
VVLWHLLVLWALDLHYALCCSLLISTVHIVEITSMLVIFLPSKLSVASYCTFLKCSCLLILGIPVTRFKQGRKTTNLNKCVTAHANLLVYHVVSVSSLALGWYEANKYLLLSLLAPVTLGTASPFCDFGMLIMFGELNFLYSNPCS